MKNLYRSDEYRVFGGVAGGLGEYFDVDPIFIRAAFIFCFFGFGFGILCYLVLWIIMPLNHNKFQTNINENPNNDPNWMNPEKFINKVTYNQKRNIVVGSIFIFVGILVFLSNVIPAFDEKYIFPLIMIVIGAFLISSKHISKIGGFHFENK